MVVGKIPFSPMNTEINRLYFCRFFEKKLRIIITLFEDKNFNFTSHQTILFHIIKITKLMFLWNPKENNEGSSTITSRENAMKRLKKIVDFAKSYTESEEIHKKAYNVTIIKELLAVYQILSNDIYDYSYIPS